METGRESWPGTLTPLRVYTLPTLSSAIQRFTLPPAPCHQFALHAARPSHELPVQEVLAVFGDQFSSVFAKACFALIVLSILVQLKLNPKPKTIQNK